MGGHLLFWAGGFVEEIDGLQGDTGKSEGNASEEEKGSLSSALFKTERRAMNIPW